MREYDELLRWSSENRCGSWVAFKSAAGFLLPLQNPTNVAGDLAALGHIEVDWATQTWTATPGVVVTLPMAGVRAVLAGSRTPILTDEVLDGSSFEDLDVWVDQVDQPYGPSVFHFSSRDPSAFAELANRLGIGYSAYPSLRILPGLRQHVVDAHAAPAPPPAVETRELWEPNSARWRAAGFQDQAGLFRSESNGRWQYVISPDGSRYFHVDLRIGRFLQLSRVSKNVLTYSPEGVTGTLSTPIWAPLPALHARSATLCTGHLPVVSERSLTYSNIPRVLAEGIASSLGQELGQPPDNGRGQRGLTR